MYESFYGYSSESKLIDVNLVEEVLQDRAEYGALLNTDESVEKLTFKYLLKSHAVSNLKTMEC